MKVCEMFCNRELMMGKSCDLLGTHCYIRSASLTVSLNSVHLFYRGGWCVANVRHFVAILVLYRFSLRLTFNDAELSTWRIHLNPSLITLWSLGDDFRSMYSAPWTMPPMWDIRHLSAYARPFQTGRLFDTW